MVWSQVMALYKLSLSLWGNKPHQGLKAVLFKGSSMADYWRQMALKGSEFRFRKRTITALFWVMRHGHSGNLCLCLEGISVALASVCMWERQRDCVVRGEEGRHVAVPQQHDLWRQRFCEVQQFRPAVLECASARQDLKHFLQLISSFFPPDLSMWMWIIKKNNYSNNGTHRDPKIKLNFNPTLKLNTNSLKGVFIVNFLTWVALRTFYFLIKMKSRFLPGHVDYKIH